MSPSSKIAVRRVLALLILTFVLLPAVLPAADGHTPKPAPAESFWSHPFASLWRLAVSAACAQGVSLNGDRCPAPTTTGGCDKGIGIDPDGGCTH